MNFESRDVMRIVNSVILNIMRAVLAIVIFMFVSPGCRSEDDPSKALPEARSMFKEVFIEFNAQKEKYYQEFREGKNTLLTFQEAMKTAQDKDAEFAKVYTKWKRIKAEVKQLHEKFANLVKGAELSMQNLRTELIP